jgi:uncharacterized protein (TIGR02246 family)
MHSTTDEQAIRHLIDNWAHAVRSKNLTGITASHSADVLLFDVPPPVQSRGIEDYASTWGTFFAWLGDSGTFELTDVAVTAGEDVAFATARIHCAGSDMTQPRLDVRLTVGLRKIQGAWTVTHEHHSVPAE